MKYWKQGFYDELVDGSVEIMDEYYNQLLAGQSAGLIIVESKNGYPILVEYEYDIEEVQKMKIYLQKVFFFHKMEKKFFEEHKDYEKSSKVWRKLPC